MPPSLQLPTVRSALGSRSLRLPSKPAGTPISPQEAIHPNIDVFAQRALVRMSRDPATAGDAVGMLAEVKAGRLGGIYKEDQRVPALRAQRIGRMWWTLIPTSEDAALVFDGDPAAPPIIAFRDRVRSIPARLDPALVKAWASYRAWLPRRAACTFGHAPVEAEITGPGGGVFANVVPPLLCQTRTPRPAAVLRGGTFVEIVQGGSSVTAPALAHAGFFDIHIGTIVVGAINLLVDVPTAGRWDVGVVQNVVVHRGELRYERGTARWFSGVPLLDVLDGAKDVWGPAPPTPVPVGNQSVKFVNPATSQVGAPARLGPMQIALADAPSISILGRGECGVLLGGSVAVMFEAGLAARTDGHIQWLATSKQPYGFVVDLKVDAKGAAQMTSTAVGKLGEILAAPPKGALQTGPPAANQFLRTIVRQKINDSRRACAAAAR